MPHPSLPIMRFLLPLFLLTATRLIAQDDPFAGLPGGAANVTASLISEQDGVAAGKPFSVALKLEHQPHWHTYWINPGIGQATTVKWELPDGFTAGPLIWPVPHVKETEIGNQHVYEDSVLLLTEITPPATLAADSDVKIAGKVNWLLCEDGGSCVPGHQDVSLTLKTKEPAMNAEVKKAFDAVRVQQPQPQPASWTVATSDTETQTVFTLTPGPGANSDPGTIYFFDTSKVIETEPQKAEAKDGKFILTLKKREATEDETALPPLAGFLHASKGWLPGGSQPALAVTIETADPFAETAAAQAKEKKAAGSAPGTASAKETFAKDEWELDKTPEDYVEYRDSLTVEDLKQGGAKDPVRGFLQFMVLIFFGGMILNLMPCVFPVLGIKILGFARLAGQDRRKLLLHAAAFAAGIIIFVWILGAVLAVVKISSGRELTWGALTQNALGLGIIVALLFVLGLNLWGLFEIGTSLTGVGGELQDKKGYAGSFWSGALTTIVSTPCSGPFLGPAMFYTLSQPLLPQFVLLTAFGLGIAFPYIFFSSFPALIKKLPRPGAWMETFKKALAFPMFAAVIYFLNAFMNLAGATGTSILLCGLLVMAIAAWIYGHWGTPVRPSRTRWTACATAFLALTGGGWLLARASSERTTATAVEDGWQRWTPKKIRDLRDQRKVVFVDYTTYG